MARNPNVLPKEKIEELNQSVNRLTMPVGLGILGAGSLVGIGKKIPSDFTGEIHPESYKFMAKDILGKDAVIPELISGNPEKALQAVAEETGAGPIRRFFQRMLMGNNAAFLPKTQKIITTMPETPLSVLGHELGHAANMKVLGKKLVPLYTKSRYLVFPSLVLSNFINMGQAIRKGSKPEDISYVPSGIATAATLPMLADEAIASGRSIKHLIRQFGKAKGLWHGKNLLPAFLTYLGAASFPLLTTYGLRKAREKQRSGVSGLLDRLGL